MNLKTYLNLGLLASIFVLKLSAQPLVIETVVNPDVPTQNRPYKTERVVLTEDTADLSLQAFAFRNTGAADVNYTIQYTGLSTVSDIGAPTVFGTNSAPGGVDGEGNPYPAGGVNTITARPDFAANATPGTTVNVSMVVDYSYEDESEQTVSEQLDFGDYTMTGIVNRAITGTVQIDAGRFVRSETTSSTSSQYSAGALTLSGGELMDNEGTRIDTTGDVFNFRNGATLLNKDAHSNTYDIRRGLYSVVNSNELSADGQGLRLVGQDNAMVEFRDADVTTDYNIQFSSSGVKNVQLSGSDFNLMFDNVEEALRNVHLDTSGVAVEFTGTALTNRTFTVGESGSETTPGSSFYIDQGRAMVGSTETAHTGSTDVTVSSTGADEEFTRVILGTGNVSSNGVTLTNAQEVQFNGPGSATVGMSYDVTFDSSTSGRKTQSANLAGLMTSGEEEGPLANQTLQSNQIGLSKTFVQDRVVEANNVTIRALSGGTISQVSNTIYSHGHDDNNTRVKVDGKDMQKVWWSDSYYVTQDSFSITPITSNTPTSTQLGGTRTLDITPEGLTGENAQEDVSYNWYTQFLNPAAVSFTTGEGFADAGSTDYANPTSIDIGDRIEYSFTTGANTAPVDDWYGGLYITGARVIRLNGTMNSEGGNVVVQSRNNEALLGGTYTARINGTFSHDLDILGADYGDLGSYYWEYTLEVERPTAPFAFMEATAGVRLQGAGLTNDAATFSEATSVDILDTNPLSDDIVLEIGFNPLSSAEGEGVDDLVSDIAEVTGLGGELFVMQMNFDRTKSIERFGSIAASTLLWYDPDDNIWRNAVDGNSDGGEGRARYAMSYADYLLLDGINDTPQLSHFGIDLENDKVWAVIDHNSSFAASAIPEPGTIIMFLLTGLSCLVPMAYRRLRKR